MQNRSSGCNSTQTLWSATPLRDVYPLKDLMDKFMSSGHGGADKSRSSEPYQFSTTICSMKRSVDTGLHGYCRNVGKPLPNPLPSMHSHEKTGHVPITRKFCHSNVLRQGTLTWQRIIPTFITLAHISVAQTAEAFLQKRWKEKRRQSGF